MLREIIISIIVFCVVIPGYVVGQNAGQDILRSIDYSYYYDGNTPIMIKMAMSNIPDVNEETTLHIETSSIFEASDTNVKIILPADGEVISGTIEKNFDLKANKPESFEIKVKFPHPGNVKITALAHKTIDRENSWGDMDVIYATIGGSNLKLSSADSIDTAMAAAELSNSSKSSPVPRNLYYEQHQLVSKLSELRKTDNIAKSSQNNLNKTVLGSGTLTVTGKCTYYTKVIGGKLDDYRDTDATQVPLKQVQLVILANSTGTQLGTGYTTDDGSFSIAIPNPYPDSYIIYWLAQYEYTDSTSTGRYLEVMKPDLTLWYVNSRPDKPNDGSYTQNIGTWYISQGTDTEHAFMIYQDLIRARQFIGGDVGSASVLWYPTSTDGDYADTTNGIIHLKGETYISADTVVHEFGHMYQYFKKGPWVNTCPSPHYLTLASNKQCAYTEGWAGFFALAVNDNPIRTWASGSSQNLETPTWGTPYFDPGDACEGRVAGALWDMYDSGIDGEDKYQYPFATIDRTMTQNTGWAFLDFWNRWRLLGYSSDAIWSIYQNTIDYSVPDSISVVGDWNGDLSDDAAIFRTSTGYWYFDNNLDGVVDKSFRYGGSTDRIIVGKWQGANDSNAIFRPSTGYWYFDYNLDGVVDKSFRYGGSTDQIIKGNWQGNNDGIAIFRPSTGYWYFDYNLDGVVNNSFRYGGSTDRIIVGKWQGSNDGIAIFRPSTGYWYFDYNLDGVVDKSFRYGGSTDQIIKGNWQGSNDGIAIFRPSTGYWYFDYNLDGVVDKSFRYGGSTDQIIKGDWNGDGSEGIGIYRPSTGYWYLDYDLDGIVDKSFRLN